MSLTRLPLRLIIWGVVVLTLLVVLVWWLKPGSKQTVTALSPRRQELVPKADPMIEPTSQAKQIGLFVLGDSTTYLVRRTSTVELSAALDVALGQVTTTLLDLPEGTSAIPAGTYLNEAYVDQHATGYLDFSNHLVKNHIGGSSAEYLTLKTILETVHLNFPEQIKKVQILIEGREVESIAGHFDTSQPLDVQVKDYVFQ
ncbi:MAG: GerMN domain-containing protein [Candidatus Poribacteria bacterium]|nr:GerMN domain-containing protein [Candidatus Poribacteria bacterium]